MALLLFMKDADVCVDDDFRRQYSKAIYEHFLHIHIHVHIRMHMLKYMYAHTCASTSGIDTMHSSRRAAAAWGIIKKFSVYYSTSTTRGTSVP